MTSGLRPDDRVLLLAIPSRHELAATAKILTQGLLVGIGTRDEVDLARGWMAEFDNAMFIEARPDQIPWREAYFSKIVVPPQLETMLRHIGAELHRLLAPGG
ncbi:MAG: hypothetical protein JOZ62_19870, partial [Acidobacteriaceae bacterium]|nr:hypothetical protein [Acidobacteriaceae bacterium]